MEQGREKVTIKLTRGQEAIVDADDYERLSAFKWFADWCEDTSSFYASRWSPKIRSVRHRIAMHREVLGLPHGDSRRGDHINGNTLDNRKSNLRVATHIENSRNRKVNKNSRTGLKGVHGLKSGRWQARIKVNGRDRHLGVFQTPELAHEAYKSAATELFGQFARFL